MKKFLFVLCFFCSQLAFSATENPSFALDAMPVSDVVRLVYVQAFSQVPYFLDPVVLQDHRPVSFRYSPKDGEFRPFFIQFLRSLGYLLELKNRADVIHPLPIDSKVSIIEDPSLEIFLYKPKFREGSYLIEMLSPLFSGHFTNQHKLNIEPPKNPIGANQPVSTVASTPGSLLDQSNRKMDQLIFSGSAKEVKALRKLLVEVDSDMGQVMVTGALYEVQASDHEGSALQIAANLLGGKFQFNFGAAQLADNFFSFKNSSVSMIMQALDSDSRFKVISSPSLRVASGSTASLIVGSDVPVLGAISYPQGSSSPVQSVEYRSSGVLFSISPEIRDAAISVKVDQQVSNFVATTTGVNNSPTLTKRQLSTSVNMLDGEVVIIGGLREDKDSGANSGFNFLPTFFKSKSSDKNHSEILLFLQIKRI